MLTKYYFKIKHVKGSDNAKTDALSRKKELQSNNKVLKTLLKLKENRRIQYNHPQLAGIYKALVSLWTQRIQETQSKDEDLKNYSERKATYIPKSIAKEFVKEFYKNFM